MYSLRSTTIIILVLFSSFFLLQIEAHRCGCQKIRTHKNKCTSPANKEESTTPTEKETTVAATQQCDQTACAKRSSAPYCFCVYIPEKVQLDSDITTLQPLQPGMPNQIIFVLNIPDLERNYLGRT